MLRNASYIKVDDIDVAYQIVGKGHPLCMLMGYSGTMDIWDPSVIDALSSNFKIVVFDNRGIGRTSAGVREFSIERFAEDAKNFMDVLGISSVHILGWSLGTYIVQEMALKFPERVDKMVLYAGDCGGQEAILPRPEVQRVLRDTSDVAHERNAMLLRMLFPHDWLRKNFDYLKHIFERPMPETPDANIRRQAAAWDAWQGSYNRLSQIKAPTLIIAGTEDVLVPPENSRMLAERISNSKLVMMEGCGHGAMYQKPKEFAKYILDFLK